MSVTVSGELVKFYSRKAIRGWLNTEPPTSGGNFQLAHMLWLAAKIAKKSPLAFVKSVKIHFVLNNLSCGRSLLVPAKSMYDSAGAKNAIYSRIPAAVGQLYKSQIDAVAEHIFVTMTKEDVAMLVAPASFVIELARPDTAEKRGLGCESIGQDYRDGSIDSMPRLVDIGAQSGVVVGTGSSQPTLLSFGSTKHRSGEVTSMDADPIGTGSSQPKLLYFSDSIGASGSGTPLDTSIAPAQKADRPSILAGLIDFRKQCAKLDQAAIKSEFIEIAKTLIKNMAAVVNKRDVRYTAEFLNVIIKNIAELTPTAVSIEKSFKPVIKTLTKKLEEFIKNPASRSERMTSDEALALLSFPQ